MEPYKDLTERIIDQIANRAAPDLQDPKMQEIWRIFFNGVPLRLASGKFQWAKIGHAKSALKNELMSDYNWDEYSARLQAVDEVIPNLVELGVLEFKRIR